MCNELHARQSSSSGNPASCELWQSSHNVWRDQAEKKGPAIKGDTASKEQQLHYGSMEAPSHAHPDPRLNNYQKVTSEHALIALLDLESSFLMSLSFEIASNFSQKKLVWAPVMCTPCRQLMYTLQIHHWREVFDTRHTNT